MKKDSSHDRQKGIPKENNKRFYFILFLAIVKEQFRCFSIGIDHISMYQCDPMNSCSAECTIAMV
jgi:hypothetical protein